MATYKGPPPRDELVTLQMNQGARAADILAAAVGASFNQSILQEAEALVNGPRQKEYAHPLDNFTVTAKLWAAYKGVEFSAEDVGIMKALIKIGRLANGIKRDSLVDLAGYAATVQMVIDERERRLKGPAEPNYVVKTKW